MSLPRQMANIGSETYRTLKWIEKEKPERAAQAFDRALDLIDLTLIYGRCSNNSLRTPLLYEICRLREDFCNAFFLKDTQSLRGINKYLDAFAKVAD